jgi:hypothetical protein
MIFNEEKVRALVIAWQDSQDDDLMGQILHETRGLIEVIVSSYNSVYRDDMIQEACIKVMIVLSSYSPERGKLHSFLTSVIRNECSSYMQHVSRNLNITDDMIESGIIESSEIIEYTEGNADLIQELIIRNRNRFPSLPTTIVDPATEFIFNSIRDGVIGKSRGTISKVMDDFSINRNAATVLYHSTLVFLRLSMLNSGVDKKSPKFNEFTLLKDFQDIVGESNCQEITTLFSGMYIKFP